MNIWQEPLQKMDIPLRTLRICLGSNGVCRIKVNIPTDSLFVWAKACGPRLNQGKSEINTTSTATDILLWYKQLAVRRMQDIRWVEVSKLNSGAIVIIILLLCQSISPCLNVFLVFNVYSIQILLLNISETILPKK
jgi:hypothetical protein